MKRKNKFITIILSQDEWEMVKMAMEKLQEYFDETSFSSNIVKHFNSISVPVIEELADKIENQRRKERKIKSGKSKQHKNKNYSTKRNN